MHHSTKYLIRAGVVGAFLFTTMGADDEGSGCAAEYIDDQGASEEWEFGEIPEAVDAEPMTCEWLESNNCWKVMMQEARACAPEGVSSINEERNTCSYENGGRLEFASSISEFADSTYYTPWVNHRLLDENGEPCFSAKINGTASGSFDVGGQVAVLEATNLFEYQIVCPDGIAYRSDLPGACDDLDQRWLDREVPNHQLLCHDGSCTLDLWGAGLGEDVTIATCTE